MARFGAALGVLVALVGSGRAHFFFVLPGEGAGAAPRLVLSDSPAPDPAARVEGGLAGKFWMADAAGKTAPLTPASGGDGWLALPGAADAAEVYGTVEYGVVLRGQPDPVLIVHHPRAVFSAVKPAARPDRALEITPVERPGGLSFLVSAAGKPVGSAEVVVYAPEEKRPRAVRTGPDGLTPAFEKGGSYAARASLVEDRAGEFQGRPYKQVRHYATLTVKHDTGR